MSVGIAVASQALSIAAEQGSTGNRRRRRGCRPVGAGTRIDRIEKAGFPTKLPRLAAASVAVVPSERIEAVLNRVDPPVCEASAVVPFA